MCETPEASRQGHTERIEPYEGIADFDRSGRIACVHQRVGKAPIIEIRVQDLRALELGNSLIVSSLECQHHAKLSTGRRQIRVKLHGLACQLIRPIYGF